VDEMESSVWLDLSTSPGDVAQTALINRLMAPGIAILWHIVNGRWGVLGNTFISTSMRDRRCPLWSFDARPGGSAQFL